MPPTNSPPKDTEEHHELRQGRRASGRRRRAATPSWPGSGLTVTFRSDVPQGPSRPGCGRGSPAWTFRRPRRRSSIAARSGATGKGLVVAAVLPPPLGDRARQAATGLLGSGSGPSWVDEIGRSRPGPGWRRTFSVDQESLIVGFNQPSGGGHASLGWSITAPPGRRRTPGSAPTSTRWWRRGPRPVTITCGSTRFPSTRFSAACARRWPPRRCGTVTASCAPRSSHTIGPWSGLGCGGPGTADRRRRSGGGPVRAGPPRRRLRGLRNGPCPPGGARWR